MQVPACEHLRHRASGRGPRAARAQVGTPAWACSSSRCAPQGRHGVPCVPAGARGLCSGSSSHSSRPRPVQRCGVCTSAVSSKRVDDRPIVSSNDYLPSTSAPQRPDVEDGMHRLLWERKSTVVFPEVDDERWGEPPTPAPDPGPTRPPPSHGCPVYVMLPLDTVWVVEREGRRVAILKRERALEIALHTLRSAGVEGVMVDVWWGICERAGPRNYDFSAYKRLFHKCAVAGLRVQAVMSFHAAGGNVGDTCKIPLPKWVVDIGERNPDIFYTDKQMHRNKECLSLGCDEVPLFWGRTPVQMYRDFINAFADQFDYLFGSVITEITVGLGPAGELRYPSYPEGDGRWRFPGVGEYQCYDRYMLQDLWRAAHAVGHPEWGHGGPHDAGHYNSRSWETGFFVSQGGNWQTPYGDFFLAWYSGLLVAHADRVLGAAAAVLNKPGRPRLIKQAVQVADGTTVFEFEPAVKLGAKLAGVHWWFKSRAHAAELTAGYYNTRDRDGYAPIIQLIASYNARLSFTCVEMRDCEHPPEGRCSPQGLLQQVLECAERYGVPLAGENALQRYDEHAFDRIAESAFGRTARSGRLEQLTFLRMGDLMFDNWDAFCSFLQRMKATPAAADQPPQQQQQQQQQQAYQPPPAAAAGPSSWEPGPPSGSSAFSSWSNSSSSPFSSSSSGAPGPWPSLQQQQQSGAGPSDTSQQQQQPQQPSSSSSPLPGRVATASLSAAVAASAAAQAAVAEPLPPLQQPAGLSAAPSSSSSEGGEGEQAAGQQPPAATPANPDGSSVTTTTTSSSSSSEPGPVVG